MVKQPIILDRYIGMLYMNQQSWDIKSLGVIGDTIPKRSGLEDCGLQIYWRVEEWGDRIFFWGYSWISKVDGWSKAMTTIRVFLVYEPLEPQPFGELVLESGF